MSGTVYQRYRTSSGHPVLLCVLKEMRSRGSVLKASNLKSLDKRRFSIRESDVPIEQMGNMRHRDGHRAHPGLTVPR